jgi:hypothetical protein
MTRIFLGNIKASMQWINSETCLATRSKAKPKEMLTANSSTTVKADVRLKIKECSQDGASVLRCEEK